MNRQEIATLKEERDELLKEAQRLRVQRMRTAGRGAAHVQRARIEQEIAGVQNKVKKIDRQLSSEGVAV